MRAACPGSAYHELEQAELARLQLDDLARALDRSSSGLIFQVGDPQDGDGGFHTATSGRGDQACQQPAKAKGLTR